MHGNGCVKDRKLATPAGLSPTPEANQTLKYVAKTTPTVMDWLA